MHWPCTRGLTVSADVWLTSTETESSAALLAPVAQEELCITYGLFQVLTSMLQH